MERGILLKSPDRIFPYFHLAAPHGQRCFAGSNWTIWINYLRLSAEILIEHGVINRQAGGKYACLMNLTWKGTTKFQFGVSSSYM
jgi:hypothetical protein